MAIARDASSSGSGSGSSVTWSHTIGSGSDRILIVASDNYTNGSNPTGCTFNGVSMTLATSYTVQPPRVFMWYLINPPTGTFTVSVNYSGAETTTGVSVSYTGVQQTGQPTATATNFLSEPFGSVTLSTNLTVPDANSWAVCAIASRNFGVGTFTNNGSFQVQNPGDIQLVDTNGPVSGSTTLTCGTSPSSSGNLASTMMSFKPSAVTVNSGFFLVS